MYRIFNMSGNPVFAAPADSRAIKLAGIERYQPFSLKRRVYRGGVRSMILLGADRYFSSVAEDPIREASGIDLSGWMDSVREALSVTQLDAVLFWPPQPDRGRVYVHLLDAAHQPVGFAKISFNDHNDACFANEAEAIRQLGAADHSHFKIPRIIQHQQPTPESHAALIFEPIPADAKPIANGPEAMPLGCLEEIAGEARPMGSGGCFSLSWWPEFERRCKTIDPGFLETVSQTDSQDALLCRTHGNFTLGNMVRDSTDMLWVFDWEESCDDGPRLSDEIGFFLKTDPSRSRKDRQSLLSRFRERFLVDQPDRQRIDVMLALAFCSTVYANDAGAVITNWNEL